MPFHKQCKVLNRKNYSFELNCLKLTKTYNEYMDFISTNHKMNTEVLQINNPSLT